MNIFCRNVVMGRDGKSFSLLLALLSASFFVSQCGEVQTDTSSIRKITDASETPEVDLQTVTQAVNSDGVNKIKDDNLKNNSEANEIDSKEKFAKLMSESEFFIAINEASEYTRSMEVSLNIKAPDSVKKMYITNTPDCGEGGTYEAVSTVKKWQLDASQSNRKADVYVKFTFFDSDEESPCFEASIIHDDRPPVSPKNLLAKYDTPSQQLQLNWQMKEASASAEAEASKSEPRVEYALGSDSGGEDAKAWTVMLESGKASLDLNGLVPTGTHYYVSVRSRDAAGNISTEIPSVKFFAYSPVEALSLGEFSSCAILKNKELKCWGYNEYGTLGQDDVVTRGAGPNELGAGLKPIDLGPGFTVKQVTGGQHFHCALSEEGSVLCWGYNAYGQLGQGDATVRGDSTKDSSMKNLKPIKLGRNAAGEPLKAKKISSGFQHVCALLENDELKCWGANTNGELGLGDKNNRGDKPDQMDSQLPSLDLNLGVGEKVTEVSAGRGFTCVLLNSGKVKCWGFNWGGVLGIGSSKHYGDGTNPMAALPTVNLGFEADGVTALKASNIFANKFHGHVCALMESQDVKCWGNNGKGQLGYGSTQSKGGSTSTMGDSLLALDFGLGIKAQTLSLGFEFTCAILSDATSRCWGVEGFGALGWNFPGRSADSLANIGDQAFEMGANLSSLNFGESNTAKVLATGGGHSCFILQDDTVKCFGFNGVGDQRGSGQLGLEGLENQGVEDLAALSRLEL